MKGTKMDKVKTQCTESGPASPQARIAYHIRRAEESVESILGILNTYRAVGNPNWSHVGSLCHIADQLAEIVDGFSVR